MLYGIFLALHILVSALLMAVAAIGLAALAKNRRNRDG